MMSFLILFAYVYLISAIILYTTIYLLKKYNTKDLQKAIEDKFPYPYYEPEEVMWKLNVISFIPVINSLVIIGIIIRLIFKINIFKYD